jgi:exodeoxyribonuclease VII small subunit
MSRKTQQTPKSFEDALSELESILNEIESGEVPLEQSLVKYERGSFLIAHCRKILGQAEQQIEVLTRSQAGELVSSPLPVEGVGAGDESPAPGPASQP